jgi:hypothetical protein
VQQRRVNLLAKLVVFTYHGSAQHVARVRSLGLDDPEQGFRILARASQPRAFLKYHVPECTAQAQPGPGQVHRLASGMSCAVLVSTRDIRHAPYARASAPRLPGSSRLLMMAQPDNLVQARLRLTFSTAEARVDELIPLLAQRVGMAGGYFALASAGGPMGIQPVPHLVQIDSHGLHAPMGIALGQESIVRAIGVSPDGTHLCIGGRLQRLSLVQQPPRSYLACTRGTSWTFSTRLDGPDGQVLAFAPDERTGRLYVGGSFQRTGVLRTWNLVALAPWAPSVPYLSTQSWVALNAGVLTRLPGASAPLTSGHVRALLSMGGPLVVGGQFRQAVRRIPLEAGPTPNMAMEASNLMVLDPTQEQWLHPGDIVPGAVEPIEQAGVRALALYDHRLWVGGQFGAVRSGVGVHARNIAATGLASYELLARHDHWAAPLPSASASVDALLPASTGLYIGGLFRVGNHPSRALLRWTDGQLRGLDHPLWIAPVDEGEIDQPARVLALAGMGRIVCVGGMFSQTTTGVVARNLACRDLSSSQELFPGQGVYGPVLAMQAYWRMQ